VRWYKHLTSSLQDPLISELREKYGADGYLVFFGTLEVYAREFKPRRRWHLDVTTKFLMRQLGYNDVKKFITILTAIGQRGSWKVDVNHDRISINIPKFYDLLDESTLRKMRDKQRKVTGESPDKFLPKDLDLDRDLDLEKDFNTLWSKYPRKVNKGQARTTFKKWHKQGIALDTILEHLDRYIATEWAQRTLDKVPHASTWLNQEPWEDEQAPEATLPESMKRGKR